MVQQVIDRLTFKIRVWNLTKQPLHISVPLLKNQKRSFDIAASHFADVDRDLFIMGRAVFQEYRSRGLIFYEDNVQVPCDEQELGCTGAPGGPTGLQGITGLQGFTGIQGQTGLMGETGVTTLPPSCIHEVGLDNSPHSTIQAGVDAAEANSPSSSNPQLVIVGCGAYTEDVVLSKGNVSIHSVYNDLALFGAGLTGSITISHAEGGLQSIKGLTVFKTSGIAFDVTSVGPGHSLYLADNFIVSTGTSSIRVDDPQCQVTARHNFVFGSGPGGIGYQLDDYSTVLWQDDNFIFGLGSCIEINKTSGTFRSTGTTLSIPTPTSDGMTLNGGSGGTFEHGVLTGAGNGWRLTGGSLITTYSEIFLSTASPTAYMVRGTSGTWQYAFMTQSGTNFDYESATITASALNTVPIAS